jgi:N-acetylmuramoyl-L-alanine amidase
MATIVIDPGHGGTATIRNDSTWNNAVGPNGTLEKTLTLDIGLRLVARLSALGHRAIATRTTDVNLRLRDRAGVARTAKADVFLSIHFNGSHRHDAQGTETLVETNHTVRSARLSLAVQDALLPVTGLRDRNKAFDAATRIKPQGLGVLKLGAHFPETAACLVEISFLDRADEEARLQEAAYRGAIADALASGIAAHLASAPRPRGRSASYGDAIEAAALSSSDARIARYLDLDKTARSRSAALQDPDSDEGTIPPDDAFAPAFLKGGGRGLSLPRSVSTWPDLADFRNFVAGLGLAHFHADEFLDLGRQNQTGDCKGLNSFPPRTLWPRIAHTAQMLDRIRAELGAPVRITSCYRSPAYNACVGGETGSLHSQFNAIDFTCQSGTPEIWRRIAVRLRGQDPRFVGGIGTYRIRNFVHIDTRGHAEDWAKP